MTRGSVATAALALLGGWIAAPVAQSPSGQAQRSPQSITAGATAILVDVVVRDRRGRPVTDLTAADFQLSEDGVPQTLDSFTRVSRGAIGVGVAWKTPDRVVVSRGVEASDTRPEPSPETVTTALVFDHLSSDGLRLAQRATLGYVPLTGESSVRVGVFSTGPGVRVVQPYTNDLAQVRRAVERVLPSGTSAEELRAERSDELTGRRRELKAETESAAAGVVAGSGAALARNAAEIGRRETELRLIQTEMNMMRGFDDLDRNHKGYDTTLALLSVIRSLAYVPGRKSVVFFSEGLPVSPALSARLDSVIDAANRANVTTYAIDAKGLRARSTLTNARKEIDAFAEERLGQVASGSDRSDGPLTLAFERVEDTLRLDSRTGLAKLAEQTGGILIEGTNDLSSAFQRIDEDNQFHYLLTYSPANTVFDGRFREIGVKVSRPGVQVFARKGYRASPVRAGADGGSGDSAALALLDRTPLPNAFPIQAAGFSFPHPARPGLAPVIVSLRTDALRFVVDNERSTYTARASVVVRIRDGAGRDVQQVSQQYLLSGEAADMGAARSGDILFYREPDLSPGTYTMEAIVFDALAEVGSARVFTLTVPDVSPTSLGMSSLVLVRRVEEVSAAPAGSAAGPLYVGRALLYPNLGEPIERVTGSELPFYFALYGEAGRVAVTAEILRNGQVLASAPVQLSSAADVPPAAGGATDERHAPRIQHVGRLPIGALPAGTYELRIHVADGPRELSRTAFFTLR